MHARTTGVSGSRRIGEIAAAYEQLVAEGYLETLGGSGTFVSAKIPEDLLHAKRRKNKSRQKDETNRGLSERGKLIAETSVSFPLAPNRLRPLASLQGLDEAGGVVYVGTFSKILSPALRIGYVVAPPGLVDAFQAAKALLDRHSPVFEQMILADFFAENHFSRHIRRMRNL